MTLDAKFSDGRPDPEFMAAATSADYRRALSEFGLDMAALDALSQTDDVGAFDEIGRQKGAGKMHHLDWDSQFFGVGSARIEGLYFADDDPDPYQTRSSVIDALLREADAAGDRFLNCRISAGDAHLSKALEDKGFQLFDVLNIYVTKLDDTASTVGSPPEDALDILEQCLDGMEWGRIYQDPNIEHSLAEKFYRDTSAWILSQDCHVTIAKVDGRKVGFAIGVVDQDTSKIMGRRHGILWLIAVDPEHRGKGIGGGLLQKFMSEFSTKMDLLEIGTQITNLPANRMYVKAGCRLLTEAHTYHRWAEPVPE